MLFTDQIPVWLKVDAGKKIMSDTKLSAVVGGKRQRKALRLGAEQRQVAHQADAEEELPEETHGQNADCYLARGPGSTDATRA